MMDETLGKLEQRLQHAPGMDPNQREELLELVRELRREVQGLSQTHQDEANSIAGFAQLSAFEATKERPNPRLVKISLEGLKAAVEQFESSHPRLVRVVNHISQMLANLGI
ncbi:MAG: DUF4404 family protein [Verrucomicrobiota bacterium]|nr:DUF4404 family protein [Limisphaera sp.]MDW8381639.1 DUF4404 family protein [Verrucomicrobiota bacterium]